MNRVIASSRATWVAVTAVAAAGCGPSGPETFPVAGKLAVKNGDLTPFVGNMVEFRSEADPTVRSFGKVKPDGSFTLVTQYLGRSIEGAVAGPHKGRFPMKVSEDEDGQPRRGKKGFDTKIGLFEKSGWEIQVPVSGEVVLTVE